MSSSKGSSNSNKTAHVMNLLRKSSPSPVVHTAAPAPETPVQQPASQPAPVPQPAPTAPIITALNADSEISLQIRDALTEELAQETENEASALSLSRKESADTPEIELDTEPVNPEYTKPPKEEISPVISDAADQEEASGVPSVENSPAEGKTEEAPVNPEPDPVLEKEQSSQKEEPKKAEPIMEPDPEKPAETAETAVSSEKQENPVTPVLVNVMRRFVEEKVDRYIRLFGVCDCPQCKNDVIALALNSLPAKYVVIDPIELALKSDMYEVRYNCEVVAQLMRACKQVKENPHHKK